MCGELVPEARVGDRDEFAGPLGDALAKESGHAPLRDDRADVSPSGCHAATADRRRIVIP
jgi:hypothetical protein